MKFPFSLPVVRLTLFALFCSLPIAAMGGIPPSSPPGPSGPAQPSQGDPSSIAIPGPLRSFLRMAGISQKASPKQVLSLLARNVEMEGYGWRGKKPQPTEFLKLLRGYLNHARQLLVLAGPKGVIHVANCDQAQPLLSVLGYRLRTSCGPHTSVEAADPKKAFLTIDSGFPLTNLTSTLRGNRPFDYTFETTRLPVLLRASDWVSVEEERTRNKKSINGPDDVVDSLVRDPALARLYWALARMDAGTTSYLVQTFGLEKLVSLAPVLDFYGRHIYVRSGRVIVPGGVSAERPWKKLVGASPESPRAFLSRLLEKDDGWMAAYFDALSRADARQQAYFTSRSRLRNFYHALLGRKVTPSAVRPVFRPNPGLVLLATRLRLDRAGRPRLPGNLAAWKSIFEEQHRNHSKIVRRWTARAAGWKNPDQLVAAMVALSRVDSQGNPLNTFLMLNEIDRGRSRSERLKPRTVELLAEQYPRFGDQYRIFAEFHALNGGSISRFLDVAEILDGIHDRALRADAAGIFQANVGLWQILARQGQIPVRKWNWSWQRVVDPFARFRTSAELFDASRKSLQALFRAATGNSRVSQDEIVALLSGPEVKSPAGDRVRQALAARIDAALDAQNLVSLDTLFDLGDGLNRMARGKSAPGDMIQLAGRLRELKMPKPLFSSSERAEWGYGYYTNPHIQGEMATNLAKIIRSPRSSKQLAAARGELVPFLRDTLVGLNYAYYQPPGADVLYNDPFFVRSHDFSGEEIIGADQTWKTPIVFGRGWTAGGGARLVGSLADLPYVLAEVEQDFIVPRNVQALIWEDLVPTLLTDSVVPRWWHVTENELQAVTLYQRFGEQLVAQAAKDQEVRSQVLNILSSRLVPPRYDEVEADVHTGRVQDAVANLTPAVKFYLAADFRQKFSKETAKWGGAGQELDELAHRDPKDVNPSRLARDFGVPHPALAQTYGTGLLNVQPLPTYMGYSSRLLAESWQSDNLYWARLAYKKGYPPVMLNLLVPELTRRMIANIFATDLEDRQALLRALRETGKQFQSGELASVPGISADSRL